jgi:uncharacterized spore protein YtfJ
MNSAENVFNAMFEKLEKFVRTETVVGEPIQLGNITLVPIVSVSFGAGAGGGGGKDVKGNDGTGSGGGVGCKITPNAMLVLKNDEVSLLPLNNKGTLEKLVEMVPEIIAKVECRSQKKE